MLAFAKRRGAKRLDNGELVRGWAGVCVIHFRLIVVENKSMKFHFEAESVGQVKAFYDAADQGDFGAASQALDPDIEWKEPNVPALWFRGIHYGAEAVRREVLEPMVAKIADFSMTMKKFFEVGSHVIVVGRYQGRVKTTGKELDAPTAHIWTLRNGKAVRFEAYHDGAKWLEATTETNQLAV